MRVPHGSGGGLVNARARALGKWAGYSLLGLSSLGPPRCVPSRQKTGCLSSPGPLRALSFTSLSSTPIIILFAWRPGPDTSERPRKSTTHTSRYPPWRGAHGAALVGAASANNCAGLCFTVLLHCLLKLCYRASPTVNVKKGEAGEARVWSLRQLRYSNLQCHYSDEAEALVSGAKHALTG